MSWRSRMMVRHQGMNDRLGPLGKTSCQACTVHHTRSPFPKVAAGREFVPSSPDSQPVAHNNNPVHPPPTTTPAQWHQERRQVPSRCMLAPVPSPPPGEEVQHSRSAAKARNCLLLAAANIHSIPASVLHVVNAGTSECEAAGIANIGESLPQCQTPARKSTALSPSEILSDEVLRDVSLINKHSIRSAQRRMHESQTTAPHFFARGRIPKRTD